SPWNTWKLREYPSLVGRQTSSPLSMYVPAEGVWPIEPMTFLLSQPSHLRNGNVISMASSLVVPFQKSMQWKRVHSKQLLRKRFAWHKQKAFVDQPLHHFCSRTSQR